MTVRSGRLLAAAIALTAGLQAAPAAAQNNENPFEEGATEGRLLGLRQGRVEGRAQALYDAFVEGFRQGLEEARTAGAGRNAEAVAAGRAEGASAGRSVGRTAGEQAARRAWLSAARPAAPQAAPEPPAAPPSAGAAPCPPPRTVRLGLVRGLSVELELEGLEGRESPVRVDEFDIDYPSEERLRQRARDAGATAEAITDWVRDYKFAFQSAWHDAFENERAGTPVGDRKELRTVGLEEGRREGERRLACEAGPEDFRHGFEGGWSEAWREGWQEGWAEADERHRKRAVVALEDAALLDGNGDGLFEPGEAVSLRATLVNAGSKEAVRAAGSWEGLRGLEGEGHFDGGLGPGERREIELPLGAIDAQAPPGTSLVVQVRGLGSEERVLTARLGRPARIAAVEARLGLRSGVLVAALEVSVEALSAAAERSRLELATSADGEKLGRLPAAGTKTVRMETPAQPPEHLGAAVTGVLVLRTVEGEPWDATRWSAPLGVGTAVALASAPKSPPELARLLLEGLASEWAAASEEAERDDALPERLQAFAQARAALAGDERRRLDAGVTAPLLERIDGSEAPRRLRRGARSALDG